MFLFYSWILKLVKKGLKKELDVIDLYTILDEDSSALLGSKLKKLTIYHSKKHILYSNDCFFCFTEYGVTS